MKEVKRWHKATEQVAAAFTKKYFPEEVLDTFWAGEEIGGVFCVADYFFDINHMIEALELKATFDQLYAYYNAELEHNLEDGDKPMPINFKNYVKHGNMVDSPLFEEGE